MTVLGDWPVYPIASHEIESSGTSSKQVAPWALELSIPNISQHTILQQTNETCEMGLHWSTGYASYMIIYVSAIPRLIKFPKRFQAILIQYHATTKKNTNQWLLASFTWRCTDGLKHFQCNLPLLCLLASVHCLGRISHRRLTDWLLSTETPNNDRLQRWRRQCPACC